MDVTGGGLKPYEMQTARAAFSYVIGEASAEEVLANPPAHYPSWRAPPPPRAPEIYAASSDDAVDPVLMGGLGARVGRFEPRPFDAATRETPTCPPGVQWVSTPSPAAEATT
jgi:hypothetical protein